MGNVVPVSGLVVTFESAVVDHDDAIELLRAIPELELGDAGGSRLALVVDSASKRRDQEIWSAIKDVPGVVDVAVAMVIFEDDETLTESSDSGNDQSG